MLIILMFLVIAMKSKIFSFSYSANEQACRSWEGAQTDSQAGRRKYSIAWMSPSGYARGLAGGWESFCSSLVQEFKLFYKFSFFQEFCRVLKNL